MPIYTPNGLKIRLDERSVSCVVFPVASHYDMNDVLLDVELWENLPEGVSAISASAAAYLTQSPVLTAAFAIAGHLVGSFVRSFTYSDFLRRALPLFVGSWLVTAVHTSVVSIVLLHHGSYGVAILLCALNIAAHLGLLNLLDVIWMPVRLPLRAALGRLPTHQEEVFVAVCNSRAARLGIRLDWTIYDKLRDLEQREMLDDWRQRDHQQYGEDASDAVKAL